MQSALNAPHLCDEKAAFAYVEAHLWPQGPVCPHCGTVGEASRSQGKTTRVGLWNCRACRKPFTVRIGTIFESSHVKLHVWLQAIYLICSSKKGISTRQIQRTFGGSMKTAWFLMHRIREAMRDGSLAPFGSGGGVVEIDETFIGKKKNVPVRVGYEHKFKVFGLVDRDTGRSRCLVAEKLTVAYVTPIIKANVAKEAHILTDDAGQYRFLHRDFASHNFTRHTRGQYVDYERPWIHTNTIEGYFSIFKKGMRGIYQHCAEGHLHRYLAEFDFRYSNREALGINDAARAEIALRGVVGKRLTYETASAGR
jgi:transposase-like protein